MGWDGMNCVGKWIGKWVGMGSIGLGNGLGWDELGWEMNWVGMG